MNLKNIGKKAVLLLVVLLAGNVSAQYCYVAVTIHNTSESILEYGWRTSDMWEGFPTAPFTGTIPPKSSKRLAASFWFTERCAWNAAWYIGGVVVHSVNGATQGESAERDIYWGFDEVGNPVSNDITIPPEPVVPPVVNVPDGWPFGDSRTGGITIPFDQSSDDGSYKFDLLTEQWVWESNWIDPAFVPPDYAGGDMWYFGIRPGGPVMSAGPDLPEWYLIPSISAPDAILEGSTSDVSQLSINNDYWLRELYRQDVKRNAMLTDLRQYVSAFELDVTVDAPIVNVEVPQVTVDAPTVEVTVDAPIVNVTIDDLEFPERFTVDTDLASEQYVYGGLNPANSEFWPDDDDMSEAWHRPFTGDVAIVNALDSGADGVAANWTVDGGASGEGGGWFEAWIGGLYRQLSGIFNKLKGSLSAFSAVGKSYTLVVPFRGSWMTLDWSPYQNIISAFRGFVVFVLWVYAVKDIRNSVAMIFGGH